MVLLRQMLHHVNARLRVAALRQRTIDEYIDEASTFDAWFEGAHGAPAQVADLNVVNVDRFVIAVGGLDDGDWRSWSAGTVAHHVSQMRAFAGHLAVVCGLPANPLARIRAGQKRRRREADALSDQEALAVLDALDQGRTFDIVTRAIVALGYEAGPRTSELATMDVADFAIAMSADIELGPVIRVTVPAKVDRERVLPLGVRAEDLIRPIIGKRKAGPLFPGRDGGWMAPRALQARLVRAGQRVGVRLNPQRLRRTAASWQAAYGASSGHLDTVFGWAPSPADVKSGHYIIPTIPQLLHAHQTRLSPLDRLELRTGVVLG